MFRLDSLKQGITHWHGKTWRWLNGIRPGVAVQKYALEEMQ
jgi:hypothetical protein